MPTGWPPRSCSQTRHRPGGRCWRVARVRAAAVAEPLQQRALKSAAMRGRLYQIDHGVVAAVDLAEDIAETGKILGVLQHERVRRAGIEPDVADVVALFPVLTGAGAEKAF